MLTAGCFQFPFSIFCFSIFCFCEAQAMADIFDKLKQIEVRYDEMTQEISSPEVHSDTGRYQKLAKQHSELGEMVAKYREWKEIKKALEGAKQLLAEAADDPEMKQMAFDEAKA